jgi:superoxide dismutase
LAPHISAETLEFHYEKHHRGYVTKLNQLSKGTEFEKMTLDEIIKQGPSKVYNVAAQVCIMTKNHYYELPYLCIILYYILGPQPANKNHPRFVSF